MSTYYDAKYPLGFNPLWFNLFGLLFDTVISLVWIMMILITGQYSLKLWLVCMFLPFVGLVLYKTYIDFRWEWIIKPLRNATYSLNMIYERRPIYRTVPMIKTVRDALLAYRSKLEKSNLSSVDIIDGFSDFVFINRFGHVQHQGTLNKAIKRIVRDVNLEMMSKNSSINIEEKLLPNFSRHTLRHTFTTRLIESGMNIKVIQEALGHSDIQTTLNIYADVTKELKQQQFVKFDDFISSSK